MATTYNSLQDAQNAYAQYRSSQIKVNSAGERYGQLNLPETLNIPSFKPGENYYSLAFTPDEQDALKAKVAALTSDPSKRDIPGDLLPAFYGGQISLEELTRKISGTPTYNPSSGPIVNVGNGPVATPPGTTGAAAVAAVTPPQPTTQQSTGSFQSNAHTVASGDTLSQIASSNGISLSELLRLNPQIKNPDLIYPGQVVNLPPKFTSGSTPGAAPGTTNYGSTTSGTQPQTSNGTSDERTVINDYLNRIATAQSSDVETRASKALKDFQDLLGAGKDAPAAPDLVTQYKNLSATSGIDTLNNDLVGVNADIAALENQISSDKYKAKGEQVSSVVINRRLVKIDADTADAYNRLQARKQQVLDQITVKQNTINTVMSLTQQNFQNASTVYNAEYNKAVQAFQIIQGAEDSAKTDAKANLQVIQNLLAKGSVKYTQLSSEQKANIQALELRSGYPAGLTEFVAATAGQGEVISTSSRTDPSGNEFFDVLVKNTDGSFTTKTISRGKAKTTGNEQPTEDQVVKAFQDDAINYAKQVKDRVISYEAAVSLLQGRYPKITVQTIQGMLAQVAPTK